MEKKCTKCGVVKDLGEFNKHKRCSYGVRNICKLCHREETALWVSQNKEKKKKADDRYRAKNREKCLEYGRKWYVENKEKHLAWTKKHREKNAEFYKKYNKKYREDNRESLILKQREHYQKNKESLNVKSREYRQCNKEKLLEGARRYRKKRRAEDVPYRMCMNFRGRISKLLKGKVKTESCLAILGYSKKDLVLHIESLFKDGMSWENYGRFGWHIDHVKPVSSFNIKSDRCPEFKKCWALENLQPLWWKDNIKKGAKKNW